MNEQQDFYRVEDDMQDTLWQREGRRLRAERRRRFALRTLFIIIGVAALLLLVAGQGTP